MTSINVEINHSEEHHQSKIDDISKTIRKIAFKKEERTKPFQSGDEVEVASQKYGFIGSYYTATIISSVDANRYRVKYKTLLTDDKSAPLEEIVQGYEVRPVPPNLPERMSEKEFCLYDMVDVFSNDGWWFGVISGKIRQEYYVYFPTTADNIAYLPDVFRFHHEWSNGKWVLL